MRNPAEISFRRRSGAPFVSGDAVFFDERTLRPLSHAETDFTSIDFTSPTGSVPKTEGFNEFAGDGIFWNSSHFLETYGAPAPIERDLVHVQSISQKLQPIGNTKSLHRSERSVLSMLLLDHVQSRNISISSLATSLAGAHAPNPL